MTPAARIQAAIEILDEVIAGAVSGGAPADRLISAYFKTRRYAGSKDRRAVRELVYSAIRVCGEVPDNGRAAMMRLVDGDDALQALFDGSTHGPAEICEGEQSAEGGHAPAWLLERLLASGLSEGEIGALMERAPLDVRINALKVDDASLQLPEEGEARWYAESLATLLTAAVLIQNAPGAVADAYVATRLDGARGRVAGAIGAVDTNAILARLAG